MSDTSVEAQSVRDHLEPAKHYVFQGYDWAFLRKRRRMTPDPANPPAFEYKNAFELPRDFVTARRVMDLNNDVVNDWTVESGYLLSDETEIRLVYSSGDYDSPNVPEVMTSVVSVYLAHCISSTLNPGMSDQLFQEFRFALRNARFLHKRHEGPRRLNYAPVIRRRR